MPFCVQGKLEAKAPFSQYSSLSGANIVYGSPTDTSSYPSDQFDIVYDNNGKDLDTCKVAIDHFKVCKCSCFKHMQCLMLCGVAIQTFSHLQVVRLRCSSVCKILNLSVSLVSIHISVRV